MRRRIPLPPAVLVVAGAFLVSTGSGVPAAASSVPGGSRPSVAAAARCADDHPATWMDCLIRADPSFGELPVSGLALPGSDNAGTFNLDPQSFDTQPGSTCTDFVPGDSSLGSTFGRWSETQDETITEQLDEGVRFIDLQVAYNGDGSPRLGWRVVQSQFSEWPLYDYLDQVANWAKSHPSEVVIVDLRNVCYDNAPDKAVDEGLLSNFDTPSDVGGGTATLAKVAFDAGGSSRSFATTTLDQVVRQRGGGHNVVVLVPGDLVDSKILTKRYHVTPVFTANTASAFRVPPMDLPVTFSDPSITPTSSSVFATSNSQLASYPLHAKRPIGSQVGAGLYEVNLTYSFSSAASTALFSTFGGLIQSYSGAAKTASASVVLPPWEAGLWAPGPGVLSRDQILANWGHRVNVVIADGVENSDYVGTVIGLNAK